MSRRPRRAHPASSEPGTASLPRSLESSLVGYRLLRRIASGERADVYLAVADEHEPQGPPTTREVAGGDGGPADVPAPRVVVLRVYDAEVPGESVTTEVEATSRSAGRVPEASVDIASTSVVTDSPGTSAS